MRPPRLPPPDLRTAFHARYTRLIAAIRAQVPPEGQRRPPIVVPDALLNAPDEGAFGIDEAFATVDAHVDRYVETSLRELTFAVDAFVHKKLRDGVLARTETIVARWPRPDPHSSEGAWALHQLVGWARGLPGAEPPPPRFVPQAEPGTWLRLPDWPVDAAPLDVARWARDALELLLPGRGGELVALVEAGRLPGGWSVDTDTGPLRIPAPGVVVLYLAEQDVRSGLARKSMAIDASKTHHDLVGGMRDWPKDGKRHRGGAIQSRTVSDVGQIERVELLTPGSKPVQLHLPMPELEGMQDTAVDALRRLRGAKGLRHWAALQRLFSVEGGRSGRLRWFLDEHLEAMGYDERQRRDPLVRADAAREVEALAAMELAIYTKGGVLRDRRRLLLETGRFERREGSEWKLDGIEFQFNERVYGGVRESTGEIGRNWMPAPIELAKIDHVRHPFAHALGLLVAIRFRWRLNEAVDRLDMTGARLLRLSGIALEERRADRAWTRLRKSLDELVRVGQLARYEWIPESSAWTMAGVCHLYSAQWLLDRAARGIFPEEKPVDPDRPTTGTELRTWRERRGWSQREAAKRLKVTQGAISQAEGKGPAVLGPKLEAALKALDETDPGEPRLVDL